MSQPVCVPQSQAADAGRFPVKGDREVGATPPGPEVVIQAVGRFALKLPVVAVLAESLMPEAESRLEQHAAYILRVGTDPLVLDDWRDSLDLRKI